MIPFPHDRAKTVIATSSGYFDLANPDPSDIHLVDIATSLSRIYRFTGHGSGSVSVARHSVNCYMEAVRRGLSYDIRKLALMHDATEAYVGDVSRPLKAMLPEYKAIEQRVWIAIADRFNIPHDIPHEVKEIDNIALISEASILFPDHDEWPGYPDPTFEMTCIGSAPPRDFSEFRKFARECGIL